MTGASVADAGAGRSRIARAWPSCVSILVVAVASLTTSGRMTLPRSVRGRRRVRTYRVGSLNRARRLAR